MMLDKLIAEFAATNFNPARLRSGVRRILQGHQAGGMPLSRFHLEYRGVVSLSLPVFQPSYDYVSRNTIEFPGTIDGGGLSTARERTSRPPETLVYFSPNARDAAAVRVCVLCNYGTRTANKATCSAPDGANVLRMVELSRKLQSPSSESLERRRLDDK